MGFYAHERFTEVVDLNQVVLPPDSVTYPLTQSPTPCLTRSPTPYYVPLPWCLHLHHVYIVSLLSWINQHTSSTVRQKYTAPHLISLPAAFISFYRLLRVSFHATYICLYGTNEPHQWIARVARGDNYVLRLNYLPAR
jgi:hypothetical protein